MQKIKIHELLLQNCISFYTNPVIYLFNFKLIKNSFPNVFYLCYYVNKVTLDFRLIYLSVL